MKRLGVQLAGSGIVVLLGALGVAQAQRDSHNEEAAQWEQQAAPAMTPPPAPIAAVEDEADAAEALPSSFGFGGFHTTPAVDPNIKTVSHDEPIADSPANKMVFPTGNVADSSPAQDPAAAGPGSFGPTGGMSAFAMPATTSAVVTPSEETNSQSAAPPDSALTFGTPSMQDIATADPSIDHTEAASAPAADYAALPTMQFGGAPTNDLRGAGSEQAAPDSFGTERTAATPLPTLPAGNSAYAPNGQAAWGAPADHVEPNHQPAALQPLESSNAQPLTRDQPRTNGMTSSFASRGQAPAATMLALKKSLFSPNQVIAAWKECRPRAL